MVRKALGSARTMKKHNVHDRTPDLYCDFPAREAFRESLFDRLMSLLEETENAAALEQLDSNPITLDDSETDAISAAGDALTSMDESRRMQQS